MAASSALRAINLVGDRWVLLILYAAFMGVKRFDDLRQVTGMARSLLVDRLKRLETAGVLRRSPYQDRPTRYEYLLTRMGADFYVSAFAILRWEKTWHYDPAADAHRLTHLDCGQAFTPRIVCEACGAPPDVRDIAVEDGPGAGYDPPMGARVNRRTSRTAPEGEALHPMLERSAEIIGDRWIAITIALAMYGKRRFGEFQAAGGMAPNILSDQLGRLVELGVLERRRYSQRPPRDEYRLTAMGRDLFPLVASLMAWADRWLAGPEGPPEILRHRTCGQPLRLRLECGTCGGGLRPGSTSVPSGMDRTGDAGGD